MPADATTLESDAKARSRTPGVLRQMRALGGLIRFSHTLFALPWALAGLFLGSRGWPSLRVLGWVLLAMVGARTAAMIFNRLSDRRFDATNPRTAQRASVTGLVTQTTMIVLLVASSGIFVLASFSLNTLCGWLSLPALALLFFYSLTKRFTAAAHFVLGLSLGLSPLGAYLAATGSLDRGSLAALSLSFAVLLWTAGFDILYSCQDLEHDRREGLKSVPARLGILGALRLSRITHALVPVALFFASVFSDLSWIYLGAVLVVSLLLFYEHRLVRGADLERINTAFFSVNVVIAVVMMSATLLDLLLLGKPA